MKNNGRKMFRRADEIMVLFHMLEMKCAQTNTNASLILLGGTAILLTLESHNKEFRPTSDIDISIYQTSDRDTLIQHLRELLFDVIQGTIDIPPTEDFNESNLYEIELEGLKNVRLAVPSPEMLACTKLFSKRGKDLIDLKESDLLNLCNREKLLELIEEYRDYVLNPEDPYWNFHELHDIFKEKGI